MIGCKTTANLDWLISRCRLSCLRVQYEWGCDDPGGAGGGEWHWWVTVAACLTADDATYYHSTPHCCLELERWTIQYAYTWIPGTTAHPPIQQRLQCCFMAHMSIWWDGEHQFSTDIKRFNELNFQVKLPPAATKSHKCPKQQERTASQESFTVTPEKLDSLCLNITHRYWL